MKFQASLSRCGTNLRQLREKQGITINALAVLADIPSDDILSFEQGKGGDMSIFDLLKIAEVLNLEIRDLFILRDLR